MTSRPTPLIRLAVPVKIFVDQPLAEADRFENLCAAIALHGGDAHLAGDFDDRLVGGLDVILLGRAPASDRLGSIPSACRSASVSNARYGLTAPAP